MEIEIEVLPEVLYDLPLTVTRFPFMKIELPLLPLMLIIDLPGPVMETEFPLILIDPLGPDIEIEFPLILMDPLGPDM